MDFDWTPEQDALRAQAREVAADAVARFGRHNDSWINGYSDEFAKEMAALGWIGLTWPTEFGGGGRPPIDRLIIAEELISAGAPIAAMWFADRQMGPTLIAFGRPDQQAEFLPGILAGDSTWCIGMSEPEAGSDLAGAADVGPPRRRRLGHQRPEDLDAASPPSPTTATASAARRPRARRTPGISEIIVPMDTPGIEVRPITDMTTNRHFCEVFFTDVRVPGRQPRRRRGQRVQADDAPARARARRRSTGWCPTTPCTSMALRAGRPRRDPLVRQEIAALETGYRIGRILVIREVLKQAPAGFSAATKCFCTEHEQRVAEFVARAFGAEATLWSDVTQGLVYAPGYTIMGGTSNIMRNILGERVLGLPREPR